MPERLLRGDAQCAQLLSSYNNDNRPRRGTDLLRGAWWARAQRGWTRPRAYPM